MADVKSGLEGVVVAQSKMSKVLGDIGRLIYSGYETRFTIWRSTPVLKKWPICSGIPACLLGRNWRTLKAI
jgi:hypothetical protein